MKLRIVALGHRMPAWVAAGYDDYARRLPRDFALDLVELKPAPREQGLSVAQVLAAEALRIRTACARYRAIALDERGAQWTTREFADRLRQWRDDAANVAFVIGSADGLAADVKSHAMAVLAVSAMTLPHGLVRVLLAEQVYRATSLLAGHPYHRE
ncbi:MAG TPA: 23S rRNA (pseudouridine(1915)-N(3))-methyltransferase RlmH [Casimicrobiaceae bacterium]|jgi:23S rRNA (pseudouridine1915-N3)-methyltransferase|nr:23S rRNA (pseudouridine(1915)-N(3))-methyltransferase RlmH [Casimicrobiaceae bacterium]